MYVCSHFRTHTWVHSLVALLCALPWSWLNLPLKRQFLLECGHGNISLQVLVPSLASSFLFLILTRLRAQETSRFFFFLPLYVVECVDDMLVFQLKVLSLSLYLSYKFSSQLMWCSQFIRSIYMFKLNILSFDKHLNRHTTYRKLVSQATPGQRRSNCSRNFRSAVPSAINLL